MTDAVSSSEDLVEDILKATGLRADEYNRIIEGLLLVAPRDRALCRAVKLDRLGTPLTYATVARNFGDINLAVADRGPVYAVWVERLAATKLLEEIVLFAEIPWDQSQLCRAVPE